jgi:hypothetical protein
MRRLLPIRERVRVVNRARQRRANVHRGRAHHLAHAIRCPDCDSDVTVTKVGHHYYSGEVRHDTSCPWLRLRAALRFLGIPPIVTIGL